MVTKICSVLSLSHICNARSADEIRSMEDTMMKKSLKTLILACAAVTMAAATLAFSACGGGGAEITGTYTYNEVKHLNMEYGTNVYGLSRNYADTLIISSDNTFVSVSVYQLYVTATNGEIWKYNSGNSIGITGTYEILEERADLDEIDIKITDVTSFWSSKDDYTVYEKGSFPTEGDAGTAAEIAQMLIGKEFTLTHENAISESLGVAKDDLEWQE